MSRARALAGRGSTALVLATGWRLQYRALRCAARCFDRVEVLGTAEADMLRHSRFCTAFHSLPPGLAFDAASLHDINARCAERGIDMVLPSDAATTRLLAAHGGSLDAPAYPVPNMETFDRLNNKFSFTQMCKQIGLRVPATRLFADKAELLKYLEAGPAGPLVAKPLALWGSEGVQVLQPNAARQLAGRIEYAPILIQDYVGGEDVCTFLACRNGEVLAHVTYRPGAHRLTFLDDSAIVERCARIARHVGCSGIIGFDMRDDRAAGRSGEVAFIECNPRFWYNMDLVMLAGMNFVELALPDRPCRPQALTRMQIVRPAGLVRALATGSSAGLGEVARYLAADLPMAGALALAKATRMQATRVPGTPAQPGALQGSTRQTA